MIIGLGNDIVNIARIEKALQRFGDHFSHRICTPYEMAAAAHYAPGKKYNAYIAKRFAAKEACAKALGMGFRNGISFQDITITQSAHGAPGLLLTGAALAHLHEMTPDGEVPQLHLALSDDYPFAMATVTISIGCFASAAR
jgi:holo-[acyl-carrier protein] synthase